MRRQHCRPEDQAGHRPQANRRPGPKDYQAEQRHCHRPAAAGGAGEQPVRQEQRRAGLRRRPRGGNGDFAQGSRGHGDCAARGLRHCTRGGWSSYRVGGQSEVNKESLVLSTVCTRL